MITIFALASLAGVELFAEVIHLLQRTIVGTITVSDWVFYLDLIAMTGITIVGIVRALKVVYGGEKHDE